MLVDCRLSVFGFADDDIVPDFDVKARLPQGYFRFECGRDFPLAVGAVNEPFAQKLIEQFALGNVGFGECPLQFVADEKLRKQEFKHGFYDELRVGLFNRADLDIPNCGRYLARSGVGADGLFCQYDGVRGANDVFDCGVFHDVDCQFFHGCKFLKVKHLFFVMFATGRNFPVDAVTRFLRLAGKSIPANLMCQSLQRRDTDGVFQKLP